jgi:hypothetical protein
MKGEYSEKGLSQSEGTGSRIPRRSFLRRAGVGVVAAASGGLSLPTRAAENNPVTADPRLFETIYSLRAIRWLKPDPIPEDTLRKIVEAGIHAPSGGNLQAWGFILVRDPELKRFIRDRYWGIQKKLQIGRPPLSTLPPDRRRTLRAAVHLAEHLHEVPVILVACSVKEYPPWAFNQRASVATVHGSIYPAV